jgi:Zn-dependent peptidase ImmA (M78 family)/DNA-binding XRE family transcriptional regulator
MSRVRATVKPEILVWARESTGLTQEEAAKKIGNIKPDRLTRWERGEDSPTINQLRTMAQVYKRPLSVFYLQEVPAHFQVMKDFRRLPEIVAVRYSPPLLLEIRTAQERRQLALELFQETGETPPEFAPTASTDDDPEDVGLIIRKALSLSYVEQTSWREPRAAFNAWRSRVEELGILVFQATRVDIDEMRGFSIAESVLPVIVVNRKDALNGRTFSLLHEFTHLMLRRSGICDFEENAVRPPEEQKIEVFCNAVAAAALMPRERFLTESIVVQHAKGQPSWNDDELTLLSRQYGVSREAVLRRILTLGRTTTSFYLQRREQLLAEYKAQRERDRDRQGQQEFRRNPPVEALSNFGRNFVRLVLNTYYQDRITLSDVSGHLGVRLRHLPAIEQSLAAR